MSSNELPRQKHKNIQAGVYNYRPEFIEYNPKLHTPPIVTRPGAMDAFKCPSIDVGGVTRPYWGNRNDK